MRGILTQLLVLAGVEVVTAENGQDALNKIETSRCQLVLMDIQMPVMNGLQATKLIRQIPAYQTLPIVAITAGGFEQDRELYDQAGMNDHLSKPFQYNDLLEVLHRNLFRAWPHR